MEDKPTIGSLYFQLNTSPTGISEKDALERVDIYGLNELRSKKKISALTVLFNQFKNLIIYVLMAAAVVSVVENEMISFYVIAAVICIVIGLGFVQEYQAEQVMASLKKLVKQTSVVRRDGQLVTIDRSKIVPGDIVLLESGDAVPADARIIEAKQARVDESMLTGESMPVEKNIDMDIYAGTQVINGRISALVCATGMQTRLGSIAESADTESPQTPLQKNISHLTKTLAVVALVASMLTMIFGVAQGAPFDEILLVALALAVASVPEGLPLTLTITLANGMKKMAEHNAVIRKLVSVETLGSTTVVCTDKTGTLTKNEMTVERVWADDVMYEVRGAGYLPEGEFFSQGQKVEVSQRPELKKVLKTGVLCNDATLVYNNKSNQWNIIGDPTEGALLVVGAKSDLWREKMSTFAPRVDERVFSSERKMMSVAVDDTEQGIHAVHVKGAPEVVVERCVSRYTRDGVVSLKQEDKDRIYKIQSELARSAYRVLALAYKNEPDNFSEKEMEESLVFLGLVAIIDPPREETTDAIRRAHAAGVSVKMITGDNTETAKAIALKVGLIDEDAVHPTLPNSLLNRIMKDGVITGEELDMLEDRAFEEIVDHIMVYARIKPEQKLRIVEVLQNKGHVVAMTGDGVNDVPAIKRADIGIAMGIKGSDVSKSASDMVLQDDNFATIVHALEMGRVLYDNIEKFTLYLVSRNFTEIVIIFLGLFIFGVHYLPLLAIHILYINIFSEVIPALGLGLDRSTDNVMKRGPRDPKERLLRSINIKIIATGAATMALIGFLAFVINDPKNNLPEAQTYAFITIAVMVLFVPFAYRNVRTPSAVFSIFENKLLMGGALFSGSLLLFVMYNPLLQEVFRVTPIEPQGWFVPVGLGFCAFVIVSLMRNMLLALHLRSLPKA